MQFLEETFKGAVAFLSKILHDRSREYEINFFTFRIGMLEEWIVQIDEHDMGIELVRHESNRESWLLCDTESDGTVTRFSDYRKLPDNAVTVLLAIWHGVRILQ